MSIVKELDLDALVLKHGAHNAPKNGLVDACVMEAVAYMAGEPWSDHPECASPVIAAFLRSWNDSLKDADRQQLKPYIPRLIGTKGTAEQEDQRVWMALDWLVRDYTPVWLRLAGLTAQADTLAGLPEFQAGMDVPSVKPAIEAVRKDADAAWAAARAAAGVAAGDAAWAAARAAAGVAAWAAAWAAARAAAGVAAWAAATRDAAWAAARAALQPAVTQCQESAHRLLDRMIAVTA